MRPSLASKTAMKHIDSAQPRHFLIESGKMTVSGHPVGAVLSIGMFILIWIRLPLVRPFLVAAIGLGVGFGLVLWSRRR